MNVGHVSGGHVCGLGKNQDTPYDIDARISSAHGKGGTMKNVFLRGSLSFAISCATVGVLCAQQPQPTTPQTPPTSPHPPGTSRQRDDDRARIVTATGCLKQEKDVPGGRPNVAERAGVGEDFILIQARLTAAKAGAGETPSAGASGRTGTGAMYKVEGLNDDELRSHINQQVEVQGRLQESTSATGARKTATPAPGTAPDEVREIRATSIKMVARTCAAGTN